MKPEEVHREDLKEYGCDFGKSLEPWERHHPGREKEKKEKLKLEKHKEKPSDKDKSEKLILEKCQRDREFDKCFKEKKDAKESIKTCTAKTKEKAP